MAIIVSGLTTANAEYVASDPINNTDPSGKACVPCLWAIPPAAKALAAGAGAVGVFFFGDDVVETATGQSDGTLAGDNVLTSVAETVIQGPINPGATTGVPDLGGMTAGEAEGALGEGGFEGGQTSDGGYTTYKHPDGSRVTIKPDGSVVRTGPKTTAGSTTGKKYRPRVDSDGQPTDNHNPDEKIDLENDQPSD